MPPELLEYVTLHQEAELERKGRMLLTMLELAISSQLIAPHAK